MPGSSTCLKRSGNPLVASAAGTCSAYKSILAEFAALVAPTGAYSDANAIAQSNLFGQAIRLVFHDAAEIDVTQAADQMGSDGCLSNTSANRGLLEASSLVLSVLEPMWQRYCDQLSRADFWVLFATLSMQRADPTHSLSVPFQFGRVDSAACSAGANRLPEPQNGAHAIQQVFLTQMGLSLSETIALFGAHTIGHVHNANSGYGVVPDGSADILQNAWDPTPNLFDNQYFVGLIGQGWKNKPVPGDTPRSKNIWTINTQGIMLNSDMVLGFNISTSSAACEHCGVVDERCGPNGPPLSQALCTAPVTNALTGGRSATFAQVQAFAQSNAAFLTAFSAAFAKLTSLGYSSSAGSATPGKLGTLTAINLATC